eukprot:scaffold5458_cov131-Isochrysis_galbana.AAC.3
MQCCLQTCVLREIPDTDFDVKSFQNMTMNESRCAVSPSSRKTFIATMPAPFARRCQAGAVPNGPVYLVYGLRGKEAGAAVSPPTSLVNNKQQGDEDNRPKMDTDGSVPTPLPLAKSGRPPPTLVKFSSSGPPTGLGGVKTLECEQLKITGFFL